MVSLFLEADASGEPTPGAILTGRDGLRKWWQIGADRVELRPAQAGAGWDSRVVRSAWGGPGLDVDGHFGTLAEATAWCQRMAQVLARDLDDEREAGSARA